MVTNTKKRNPSPNEQAFIDVCRRIHAGQAITPDEVRKNVNGTWQEVALELLNADGDFWTVYDVAARDREQLDDWREMVKVAPEQGEVDEVGPHFTKGKNGKRVLKLASIDDIYALPDPQYLISRVLEAATVSLLYGVSGTGKTFTALHLALSVAHGILWHGRKVKQSIVWYINTEGGRGLKKRLKAWYQAHPHLTETSNFKVIPWSLDLKENFQDLLDTIDDTDEKPALIVADNFSMCTPGVEQNKQEQVSPILRAINLAAQEYACHFLLIHHTNKEGDFNGTMAFRNHVDVMIELRKEDKADKHSPIVFSPQKARDEELGQDIRTELKQVTLYIDPETLEPVTSCVVVDTNQPEPEKPTPEAQVNVLRILKAHVKLTCSQWQKLCQDTYQVTRPTFYRIRTVVEREGLVAATGSHYALTEKGGQAVD